MNESQLKIRQVSRLAIAVGNKNQIDLEVDSAISPYNSMIIVFTLEIWDGLIFNM